MDKQSRVETVEEFKLRMAAIIRAKPEHIPGAPRPNPLSVRPKKRAKSRKSTTSLGSGFMRVHKALLAIVQVPSYIPGGAWSFWKFIGLLLSVVGFAIALWLIWVVLRWVAKKLAATFRKR
jgi:hypothetical protein